MVFGLLMTDIPVYISCKFVMYIFKIALVISENVRIAFLYVLSIQHKIPSTPNYIKNNLNAANITSSKRHNLENISAPIGHSLEGKMTRLS